ncbi:lipocalin-like domain-containing protein [Desulfotalea psychrophila]|uniref:Lipocalin-like domain-containing protein n=1 Tax=Desulfotalea psychrophila (strain LSv54 / DSM 12343) TaxID=177439 RepID=Q6AR98_DESPS|nr:lipocalin family protein [Desulfotalea psychrophila]CAG35126.1 unknown protein [Desulfotalea psychrophila LSv54]
MKFIFSIVLVLFLAIAGLGIYKFNLLEDDIYMSADAVRHEDMIGGWVRPIESMPGEVEGFELRPNGVAVSINMATLPYTSWQLLTGKLILKGRSVGNGTSSVITETYTINSVGKANMSVIDEQGRDIVFDHQPLKEPNNQ